MQNKKRFVALLAGGLATLALAAGGLKVWAGGDDKSEAEEVKVALPSEQVIAAIRTAVAAKPGRVLEVETESEGGKTLCEVEVLAADGKTYEVAVDVASNTAASVELEDDDADEDGED